MDTKVMVERTVTLQAEFRYQVFKCLIMSSLITSLPFFIKMGEPRQS